MVNTLWSIVLLLVSHESNAYTTVGGNSRIAKQLEVDMVKKETSAAKAKTMFARSNNNNETIFSKWQQFTGKRELTQARIHVPTWCAAVFKDFESYHNCVLDNGPYYDSSWSTVEMCSGCEDSDPVVYAACVTDQHRTSRGFVATSFCNPDAYKGACTPCRHDIDKAEACFVAEKDFEEFGDETFKEDYESVLKECNEMWAPTVKITRGSGIPDAIISKWNEKYDKPIEKETWCASVFKDFESYSSCLLELPGVVSGVRPPPSSSSFRTVEECAPCKNADPVLYAGCLTDQEIWMSYGEQFLLATLCVPGGYTLDYGDVGTCMACSHDINVALECLENEYMYKNWGDFDDFKEKYESILQGCSDRS